MVAIHNKFRQGETQHSKTAKSAPSYQSGDGWPFQSAAEHHALAELQTGSPLPS